MITSNIEHCGVVLTLWRLHLKSFHTRFRYGQARRHVRVLTTVTLPLNAKKVYLYSYPATLFPSSQAPLHSFDTPFSGSSFPCYSFLLKDPAVSGLSLPPPQKLRSENMANPNRNATIPDSPEGVVANRKVNLCPKKQQMDLKDLIITCDECGQFLLFCCGCSKTDPDRIPCHNGQVIFVDGACQNNGTTLAQSGMGLAMGATSEWQLSFPITNEEDDSGIRSNQRAELCAAKHALDLIDARSEEEQESASYSRTNTQRRVNHRNRNDDKDRFYIVATDSEYVVKGMTEWLPTWKVRFKPVLT